MSTVTTAVAKREEELKQRQASIARYLRGITPEIARALPKHLDADRIARLALTVVRKDPKLAECTPESFAGALLTSSALGLEPGVNGEAYLVAYKGECTLIVGWQGLTKLFYQHPMARHIDAQAVHEHDDFDYAYGSQPFLRHKPASGDRGRVVSYYAVAGLSSGATAFVVLSPEDVKRLRGGKVGPKGDIPDPMHWMERKTALRQLVKLLPKSTALTRALDADDKGGHELYRERLDEVTGGRETAGELPAGPDAGEPETVTAELVDDDDNPLAYSELSPEDREQATS